MMRYLYTLILCFVSFFCLSQENDNLNDLLFKLNSKKNISFTVEKPKYSTNQKYCLVPILETSKYDIFFPFSIDDLNLKRNLTKSSGGNILIYFKEKKQYLVLNYFTGESITRKNKKNIKLNFNFKGWDLVNSLSILMDDSLTPTKHISFPSEINNIKSEMMDNTMTVQKVGTNIYYNITLNKAFYNLPLDQLFDYFYLNGEKEYSGNPINYSNTFYFLKQNKICFCK